MAVYPRYLGAQLGSGMYDMPTPQGSMLGSGLFQPAAQGVLPQRRLRMPLGSGMYESPEQFSPYELGSGLYGQAQLPVQPQVTQPQPPGPRQLAPVEEQSSVGAPNPAEPGFADKFASMLSNPVLQFGLNLLGGSNNGAAAWSGALQNTLAGQAQAAATRRADAQTKLEVQRFGLEKRKTDYEGDRVALDRQHSANETRGVDLTAQGQAMNAPLIQANTALANANVERAGAQTSMEKQQQDLALKQFEQQQREQAYLMSMLPGMPGSPQVPGSPQGMQGPMAVQPTSANAAPQSALNGPTGKYGTPTSILDGLEKTESSGNPKALGPALPDGTRAEGAYQFLPSTTAMLKSQGMNFDPFDRNQARDAADFYFSNIMKKNGGDVRASLADYGGFKTKDPTSYVNKVLTAGGIPPPQAPQGGGQTAPASDNAGLRVAQVGAVGAALKGNFAPMVEYGKLLQPQNVAAGSYQRDPSTGTNTFMPNPYEAAKTANDTTRTTNETAKTAADLQTKSTERATTQTNDTKALGGVQASLQRLGNAAGELATHPGLQDNFGWRAMMGFNKVPNSNGADAASLLDNLKSGMVIDTMSALKSASATGSTGFGSLSEPENKRLQDYIANFNSSQTVDSAKKALAKIQKFTQDSYQLHQDRYNSLYGKEGAPGVSAIGPQEAPQIKITPTVPTTSTAAPKTGTVQDGYVFLGGDPANKQSWAPAPKGR